MILGQLTNVPTDFQATVRNRARQRRAVCPFMRSASNRAAESLEAEVITLILLSAPGLAVVEPELAVECSILLSAL